MGWALIFVAVVGLMVFAVVSVAKAPVLSDGDLPEWLREVDEEEAA